MDRLPLKMGDLYVDVTPDRFALIPSDVGYAVFEFRIAVPELHESDIRLLVPFDSLEAQSEALIPRQREVQQHPEAAMWEPQLRATLPDERRGSWINRRHRHHYPKSSRHEGGNDYSY